MIEACRLNVGHILDWLLHKGRTGSNEILRGIIANDKGRSWLRQITDARKELLMLLSFDSSFTVWITHKKTTCAAIRLRLTPIPYPSCCLVFVNIWRLLSLERWWGSGEILRRKLVDSSLNLRAISRRNRLYTLAHLSLQVVSILIHIDSAKVYRLSLIIINRTCLLNTPILALKVRFLNLITASS